MKKRGFWLLSLSPTFAVALYLLLDNAFNVLSLHFHNCKNRDNKKTEKVP